VDEAGNIVESDWYDIDIEPAEETVQDGDTDTDTFNAWGIGVLILFAMVAIGLNIARLVKKPGKPSKPGEEDEPIEDDDDDDEMDEDDGQDEDDIVGSEIPEPSEDDPKVIEP